MSAANALLRAIHARLAGDPGLTALIEADGVRDVLMPRPDLPAIVFADLETRDLSTSQSEGEEHFLMLEIWSAGEGRRQALDIAGRVKALLDNAALALDGAVLVSLFVTASRSRREPKTKCYLVELRFRAVTE